MIEKNFRRNKDNSSLKNLRILFLLIRYYSSFITFILIKPLDSYGLYELIAFFSFCQSFQELLAIADYGTKYKLVNGRYKNINLCTNYIINFFILIFVILFSPSSYQPAATIFYLILALSYPLNLNNFRNIQEGFIHKVIKNLTITVIIQTVIVSAIYLKIIQPSYFILCIYLLVQNLIPGLVNFKFKNFSFKLSKGSFKEGFYPSLLMITSYIGISSIYLYDIPSKSLALFAIAFRIVTSFNLTQIYNNTFTSDFRNNLKPRSFKAQISFIIISAFLNVIIIEILLNFYYEGFAELSNFYFLASCFIVILLAAQNSFMNSELIANNKIKKFFKIELIACLFATLYRYFLRENAIDIMNSVLVFYLLSFLLYYYSNKSKFLGKLI